MLTLTYRIRSHGGILYVRESIRGEIVARIPSDIPTEDAASAAAMVDLCKGVFLGNVLSVRYDIDCVKVICVIPIKVHDHQDDGQFELSSSIG